MRPVTVAFISPGRALAAAVPSSEVLVAVTTASIGPPRPPHVDSKTSGLVESCPIHRVLRTLTAPAPLAGPHECGHYEPIKQEVTRYKRRNSGAGTSSGPRRSCGRSRPTTQLRLHPASSPGGPGFCRTELFLAQGPANETPLVPPACVGGAERNRLREARSHVHQASEG